MNYDYIIIGGGIVGISSAWQLLKRSPGCRILVLEKEPLLAMHQTGHNSGVIHAGVYYRPGSLKAEFCRQGNLSTIKFCRQYDIAYDQCGKLIVATNKLEYARMKNLFARSQENSIDVHWMDRRQLKNREPNIDGLGAFLVPTTGIVSYGAVTNKMAQLFVQNGGEVQCNCDVLDLVENDRNVRVHTTTGTYRTRYLVTCAGLMADRIIGMLGLKADFRIVPFRGEYYQLPVGKNRIINHLIYPVSDPALPFLGIHLTRMIDGRVTVGPNAVLSFKREGYNKMDLSFRDIMMMVTYGGFWKLLGANWQSGIKEFKNSILRKGYLAQIQKYCPQLQMSDLVPYPAGVRAQCVRKDGSMIDDFLFVNSKRTFHVCNAPSPAATASIPIGSHIVDRISNLFDIRPRF